MSESVRHLKTFTADWVSEKTALWSQVLAPIAGGTDIRGLEIGCYEGRSACWFLDHILTGRGAVLHCVDPWVDSHLRAKGSEAESRFLKNTEEYGDRIVVYKRRSLEYAVSLLSNGCREIYNFIYVDGAHEAAAVLSDLVLYWPLLKPGGILICDDYGYRRKRQVNIHPSVAIDSFFACRNDWVDVHKGYQRIVSKRREMPSVTAVMVTGHDPRRRPLALLTARAFPQQTYPNAELLIVNQGAEPLLPEPISRVKEVMDGAGLVVGALRNLAWRHATGDLMTCWDDDDVHHPDRLIVEVAQFTGRPVVLQNELFLHLRTADAFAFHRRSGYENSLLWPRQCESRYPELPRRSDARFCRSLIREFGELTKIDNRPSLYVRLFHGRNIWPEDHFFGLPRRQAANPRKYGIRIVTPTPAEQRLIEELLPSYREVAL